MESAAFYDRERINVEKAGREEELSRNHKEVTAEQRALPSGGGVPIK